MNALRIIIKITLTCALLQIRKEYKYHLCLFEFVCAFEVHQNCLIFNLFFYFF